MKSRFVKSKKTLAVILAASMMAAGVSGCSKTAGNADNMEKGENEGSGENGSRDDKSPGGAGSTMTQQGDADGEESILNPPGTFPIVKEPITITIFAPADGDKSRGDNVQTKELEEKTGIHIEWQIAASSDSVKDKLSTMFASKNMTDIILTGVGADKMDKATEAMIASQGLIMPLNDLIDNYSVGYKKAFEEIDGLKEYITTPDGNIYSLPNVDGSLHMQYLDKLWINTVWLDNLGLSMPETTDELVTVLRAFKEQDANGNGDPNDEIPLSTIGGDILSSQLDGFLMNPFQLTPDTNRLYLENDRVVYSPTTDKYKEGLKYLQMLYKEGLINPESFTQDHSNQVNVNEAGEVCAIGAFLGMRPGFACDLTTMPNSRKWEQYQSVPPLKGPEGQRIAAWNPYVGFQSGMTFISSTCEYPEAAFRLLDYLATEEMTYRSALGIEGKHWQKAEDGELGMNGKPALYKRLNVPNENESWDQLTCLIRTPEFVEGEAVNQDPYAEGVLPLNGRQIVMYQASLEHAEYAQPMESVMPELYMSEENAAELSFLKTNVTDTHREAFVQFVTGARDIDTEWDSYLQSLENVGLSQYLSILQEAYDSSIFSEK